MLTLEHVWLVVAVFLVGVVVLELRGRRWRAAAFWTIVAVPFAVGDRIADAAAAGTHWPAQAIGAGVIALGVLAPRGRAKEGDEIGTPEREDSARRLGNWLFVPALAIPAITLVIFVAVKLIPEMSSVLDPAQSTLIALAFASVVALVLALVLARARPRHAFGEGRRLLDAIGWAAVLPMMLATLGTVFAKTGVGDAIAQLAADVIPVDRPYVCLVAYALGMIVFTAIMGNAFAAFPVLTAGIGVPLLVVRHGADPAALGALGMVTGYCGTLLTPMAANFNIVPAALLELDDDYAVIRAQWPTAVLLIAVQLVILSVVVFR
jgi:uncharacterized membrane protein